MGEQLLDADLIMGEIDYTRKRRLPPCPVWRADSLIIAEAIRWGERQVMVRAGAQSESPEGYIERIAGLRRTYSVIAFVPAHAEVYAAGQQAMVSQAASMVQDATQLAATAQTPLPAVTGQMLHQAIDAYAQYAAKRDARESSLREAAAAKRLKPSHPDIALSQFGISGLERMAAYWAARPKTKTSGQPMALESIKNILKTARRFVRWLHRSDQFTWTKPVDAEDSLRVNVERLRTGSCCCWA